MTTTGFININNVIVTNDIFNASGVYYRIVEVIVVVVVVVVVVVGVFNVVVVVVVVIAVDFDNVFQMQDTFHKLNIPQLMLNSLHWLPVIYVELAAQKALPGTAPRSGYANHTTHACCEVW